LCFVPKFDDAKLFLGGNCAAFFKTVTRKKIWFFWRIKKSFYLNLKFKLFKRVSVSFDAH